MLVTVSDVDDEVLSNWTKTTTSWSQLYWKKSYVVVLEDVVVVVVVIVVLVARGRLRTGRAE